MQDVESLELMKDEVGDIFYPEQQINTITNWEVTDGYQIYVNSKDTLEIEGTPVNPNSYPIAMQASKWYIISYLFDSPSPITTALSRIDSSIVLVKNDDGQIWYPAYGINQIGNMRPTEGYKIVLNENNTLIYNTAPLFGKIANNEIAINEYYETDFKQTGSNCSVILKLIDFDYADEFAVKTKSGDIVGTGINTTGTVALTVWGDNTYTEVKDGLAANEEISLYVWSKKENKEYPILIKEYKDLLSNQSYSETLRFVSDGIFEVVLTKDNISSVSELDSQLEIYPNPAQDYINITNHNYETYSILDLLGNKIQSGTLEGKNIPIRSIPAGTYLLRLEAKLNSSLHNFTIIR
jgi:hypothetical protein